MKKQLFTAVAAVTVALLASRADAKAMDARDPLAGALDRERAREHALRPPLLLGFIVSVQPRSGVPEREQWLAAGAALGNLLNAAHLLGFGAIVLSGDRCFDPKLLGQIGLRVTEELVGFISVGTVMREPPQRSPRDPHAVWKCWSGQTATSPSFNS